MKFEEAFVLLPCHSLEDFPTHYEGAAAEGLLACWSALWHPTLLAECGRLPTWYRADGPPDALAAKLIVVPQTSEPLLLAGWASRAAGEGAHVVRKLNRRGEIVAALLAGLEAPPANIDAELVADFLALGYGYLAVELLTRQMRYMSNIDEVHLQNEALAAARACLAGDEETTRQHLKNSFDVLVEARERFYPVDAYLVDLTLVAPTTVGPSLCRQLSADVPQNLLISGEAFAQMVDSAPDTLAALRVALDHGTVSLVGGERHERELPLLPIETVLTNLRDGGALFEQYLGQRPRVYGRRRFGLSPILPQILARSGFLGAFHATLDDGQFPTASQSKVRWEGLDYSAIDSLVRLPLDANRADTFLGLPRTLGEAMDRDHVATLVFAHWPSQMDTFYTDLRRMAAYGPVLGKFITLSDYFEHTTSPGELVKFKTDNYRSPYLRQAVSEQAAQPLSAIGDEHRRHAAGFATEAVQLLGDVVGAPVRPGLDAEIDADKNLAAAGERVARALAARDARQNGVLVVNPHSFAVRSVVEVSSLTGLPTVEGHVTAVQQSGTRKLAVAEVPGMGFCWIAPGDAAPAAKKPPPSIARENSLVNEYLRVDINPATGAIQAIYDLAQRGNRLAVQLALRTPGPRPRPGDVWRDSDETAEYSSMQAESLEIADNGPAQGAIIARGRLTVGDGQRVAGFVQHYSLAQGARVVTVDTELEIDQPPGADPWESYFAARFAWGDEAADTYRDVGLTRQPTEARRIEAPHFVDIRSGAKRTTILTGGLPYHRRVGFRMLDTLLVAGGETRRKFRYAVGVDLAHPLQQSLELLQSPLVVGNAPRPAGPNAANWLFHVGNKNVVATHWSPLWDGERLLGFRTRLLETDGAATRVRLRAPRDVASAHCVDFRGEVLSELPVAGDSVTIDIAAFEWLELDVHFA